MQKQWLSNGVNNYKITVMNEIYEYKEVEFDQTRPYIDQLNEMGTQGWEFALQAQRVENTVLLNTGQPKLIIVTIYKRRILKTNGTA